MAAFAATNDVAYANPLLDVPATGSCYYHVHAPSRSNVGPGARRAQPVFSITSSRAPMM